MVITVTLKNSHQAGGRRQVAKALTLKGPQVEALRNLLRDHPDLKDLLIAIEEVAIR